MPPFRAPLVCAVAACLLSGAAAFAPGSSLPVLFGRASPAISGCLALRAAKKATNRPYFEQAPGTKIKRVRDKAGKAQKTAEDAAAIASKRQMEGVEIAVRQRAGQMTEALEKKGYWACDDFLGRDAANQMILEAAGLEKGGMMSVGQSTRWNADKGEAETYEKENVVTMQLQGGEDYFLAPRLTEYVVKLTAEITKAVNAAIGADGSPILMETHQTNKLAVCRGDKEGKSAFYLKHYDNQGGADRRKLTCLYYMNQQWDPKDGGCFRAFSDKDPNGYEDIEPSFDRFLCFWSDKLVHSVEPYTGLKGRFALTVWLYAADGVEIARDEEAERVHFPDFAQKSRDVTG